MPPPDESLRPDYPAQMERWWLEQARRVSGIERDTDALNYFEPAVRRLSELFTTGRSADFGGYADQSHLLAAYGLFFFPQTFVRVQWVLREWHRTLSLSLPASVSLLDLGCGAGAAAAAAAFELNRLAPGHNVEACGMDVSENGLRRMTEFMTAHRSLWPHARFRTLNGSLTRLPGPDAPAWDLMLVSFALNEVFEQMAESAVREWVERAVRRLNPGGRLVLVEPAGRVPSPRLERLRDWAIQSGAASVPAPCLHARPCPLLERGGAWCHEVRVWRVPDSIAYLNRKLQRTVEDVKFSFLILAAPEAPPPPGDARLFRMISPPHKVKGRIVVQGCATDGAAREYELLTRRLDRPAEKALLAFERGDLLIADNPKPLASGAVRVENLRSAASRGCILQPRATDRGPAER